MVWNRAKRFKILKAGMQNILGGLAPDTPWELRNQLSLNPFFLSAPFLYPLKTSENLKVFFMFSGVIKKQHQGVEKGSIGNEWDKRSSSILYAYA